MDQYSGEIELSDGNRAHFLLTVVDGRAVTECGFLKQPTEENLAEFELAMHIVFEDMFGRIVELELSRTTAMDNPETARQQREAFLHGVSNN